MTKEVTLNIRNEVILNENSIKLLGITIDNELKFNEHVSNLCKKASQKLHALARVAQYIDSPKLRILLKAFIESHFNYCPLVWMFHNRTMNNRINRIQERALKIAYKDTNLTYDELLKIDNSFTVHERNLQRLATEIYKAKHDLSPSFMKNIFNEKKNTYNLRQKPALKTSNVKTVYCGTETISYRAPQIWQIIPDDIKLVESIDEFKKKIKTWKPEGCMCRLCKIYIPKLGFI